MTMRVFKTWLPFAFLTTIFCGLVYGSVQQSMRMATNDPQVQMAEDAVAMIENGQAQPQNLIPPNTVDISQSLAAYITIFDGTGHAIAGNGFLDNKLPSLPQGIFDSAKTNGEDRFTWEPEPGVRSAIVISYAKSSGIFVMAGRSLRETEARENNLFFLCFTTWIIALIGTGLMCSIHREKVA
jgi:hypothetical protein